MDSLSVNQPTKGFFKKPEGKLGMTLLIGGIVAALWFWSQIYVFVLSMLVDTLHIVMLGGILFALGYMILDGNIRAIVWNVYKMICRAVTGIIVEMNPLQIIRNHLTKMKETREEVNQKINIVSGEAKKMLKDIDQNTADAKKNKELHDYAVKHNASQEEIATYEMEFGLLVESNNNLGPHYNELIKIQAFLEKIYKSSGFQVTQLESTIRVKEREYKAIIASNKAMRSAMSLIKGNPDQKAIFDMAMEHIADDMAMKIGEMERAMNLSTQYLNNIDRQTGVATEKGKIAMDGFNESQFKLLTVSDVDTTQNAVPVLSVTGVSHSSSIQF